MDKEQKYNELLARLEPMIQGEKNPVSVMANASALMREVMGDVYFWVGFYTVNGDTLELGPFQGTSACYRIKRGRGVRDQLGARRDDSSARCGGVPRAHCLQQPVAQ